MAIETLQADRQQETEICGESDIIKLQIEKHVGICSPEYIDAGLGRMHECKNMNVVNTSMKLVDSTQSGEVLEGTLEVCITLDGDGDKSLIEEYLRRRELGRYPDIILGNVNSVEENRSKPSNASKRDENIEDSVLFTQAAVTTRSIDCEQQCLKDQLHRGMKFLDLDLGRLEAGQTNVGTECARIHEVVRFGSLNKGTSATFVAEGVVKESGLDAGISVLKMREDEQVHVSKGKECRDLEGFGCARDIELSLIMDARGAQNLEADCPLRGLFNSCGKMGESPKVDLSIEDTRDQRLDKLDLHTVSDSVQNFVSVPAHESLSNSETNRADHLEQPKTLRSKHGIQSLMSTSEIYESDTIALRPESGLLGTYSRSRMGGFGALSAIKVLTNTVDEEGKSSESRSSSGISELCPFHFGDQERDLPGTLGTRALTNMHASANNVNNIEVAVPLFASAQSPRPGTVTTLRAHHPEVKIPVPLATSQNQSMVIPVTSQLDQRCRALEICGGPEHSDTREDGVAKEDSSLVVRTADHCPGVRRSRKLAEIESVMERDRMQIGSHCISKKFACSIGGFKKLARKRPPSEQRVEMHTVVGGKNCRGERKLGNDVEGIEGQEGQDRHEECEEDHYSDQEALHSRRAIPAVSSQRDEVTEIKVGRGDFKGRKYRIVDGFWELRSDMDEEDLIDEEEVGNNSKSEGGSEICLSNLEETSLVDMEGRGLITNQGIVQELGSEAAQGPLLRSLWSEFSPMSSPEPISESGDCVVEGAISTRTRASYSLVDMSIETLEALLPEGHEEDYHEMVDDEEEYHKFLSAFEGDVPQQQHLVEDDESDDEDGDFDIKLQEELERNDDSRAADVESRKRKCVQGPETRQKRRRRRKLHLCLNNPTMFTLPASLPFMNGISSHSSVGEDKSALDRIFNVLPLSREDDCASQGFTALQFGQLYCLIHEHVQLLVQVFAVSLFDPEHQDLSERLKGMLMELAGAREMAVALRKIDFPGFFFRPPYIQPSVIEDERTLWPRQSSTGYDCDKTFDARLENYTSSHFRINPGPIHQTNVVGLPTSPTEAHSQQSSPLRSPDTSMTLPIASRKNGSSPSGAPPSSPALVATQWQPIIRGQVHSLLDVEPLRLVSKFLHDIGQVAEEYKKQYRGEGVLDECCEMVPLFPVEVPIIQTLKRPMVPLPTLDLAQGTLTSTPVSQALIKKPMSTTLVESTKIQSVALVPKAVAVALERFSPLFNKALFPHIAPRASSTNRLLFTDSEDQLLAMGLMMYNTDFDAIQKRYLPSKSTHQIFVRQKNRSSARAPDNIIKKVRQLKASLLTPHELGSIQKGLKKYNFDWAKVWEHCVPYRDPARLPRQWRHSLNVYKSCISLDDDMERCHLTDGKESAAPVFSKYGNQAEAELVMPVDVLETEEECNCRADTLDKVCISEADKPYSAPIVLQSGNNMSNQSSPVTSKLPDSARQMLKKDSYLQIYSPPLFSSKPMAVSDATMLASFESPHAPQTYPVVRKRLLKSQMVKLAPGLPPLKLPPTGRVMSRADIEYLPGSEFFNKYYHAQPISGVIPFGLPSGHDGTGLGHIPDSDTGFSMRHMVCKDSGTNCGNALQGDGVTVLGKRKNSDKFAAPNVLKKRPVLVSDKQGGDIIHLDSLSNSPAEKTHSSHCGPLIGISLTNGQHDEQLHTPQENEAAFSGSLSPVRHQCKGATIGDFVPKLRHPYWHPNPPSALAVGLPELQKDHIAKSSQNVQIVRDFPSLSLTSEMINSMSQQGKRSSGKLPPKQISKPKALGTSKAKLVSDGLQIAQEIDRLKEEVRGSSRKVAGKNSSKWFKKGRKKRASGVEKPLRCERKQVVLAENSSSRQDSLLKHVITDHNNDRHLVRDVASIENILHPSCPLGVQDLGRASRTRRLRGAGVRGVVPRNTRRKDSRREQELHQSNDSEEPFFEPHIIVMEAEEHSSSDYDNYDKFEEASKSVRPRKVASSRQNLQAGEMAESRQVTSPKQKQRAAELGIAESLRNRGAADMIFMAESAQKNEFLVQLEKGDTNEDTPLLEDQCVVLDNASKRPGLSDNELHQAVERAKDDVVAVTRGPSSTTFTETITAEPCRKRDTRIPSRFYKDDMLGFIPRPRHIKRGGVKGRGGHSMMGIGRRGEKKKGVNALMVATQVQGPGGGYDGSTLVSSVRKSQPGKRKEEHGELRTAPKAWAMEEHVLDDGSQKISTEVETTVLTSPLGPTAGDERDNQKHTATEGRNLNEIHALEATQKPSQRPCRRKKVAIKLQS